jgi:hypothetical protein
MHSAKRDHLGKYVRKSTTAVDGESYFEILAIASPREIFLGHAE